MGNSGILQIAIANNVSRGQGGRWRRKNGWHGLGIYFFSFFFFLHTIDEPMCRDLELKMRFRISDHVTPVTAPNIVVASAAARSSGPKNIQKEKIKKGVRQVEVAGLFPFRVGGDR